jgi:hypothetical protein
VLSLQAIPVPLFFAVALSGCGGSGVDAKANASLDRLDQRERAAARVLVELEKTSRDENTATLCRRVYAYDGTQRQCERAFRDLFDRQRSMSLEIRDLALRDDKAIAHAEVTIVDNEGDQHIDSYTFRLLKAEGTWRVLFQQ